MAWLAVDKDGRELLSNMKPRRYDYFWAEAWSASIIYLPKGSIKKLIGRELKWSDDAVELK